ncbi:hypothetical protein RhiirA4_451375 [Rhizophagus irregularis]|uniref:Uncharacterized protein n=1 Tax=Rhizophagus irregularis TaxID=588596 RepID=A0A2I1FVI5_9GLOM|nr:hypothetical protein RhiirA4_451375 [Rhizophagus irregularis]
MSMDDSKNVKEVHSNRLGISYTVTINKYNRGLGQQNRDLKNEKKDNYATKKRSPEDTAIRPYFKQYGSLRFDIVRSPQQIARWNRLTCSVMRSEEHSPFTQPKIIRPPTAQEPDPAVFKQLRHLPTKLIPFRYGRYIKANSTDENGEKNRLRSLRARNKRKKRSPPLPPGTPGNPRVYYKRTYNINLFDYKVRKRFDVSSIPQYNYGYAQALVFHQTLRRKRPLIIETIPEITNKDVIFVTSEKNRNIINDPTVFLRRSQ